jgi:hypothetical protein
MSDAFSTSVQPLHRLHSSRLGESPFAGLLAAPTPRYQRVVRPFLLSVLLALPACDRPGDKPPPQPPKPATPPVTRAASGSGSVPPASHDYAAKDFRLASCARLEPSGVITAVNCRSGFVVYGPYANAAGDSDVELSFSVEATKPFNLYVELVSAMGTKRYAALPQQSIEAHSSPKLGLVLHTFAAIDGLEARLVVSGAEPIEFKIRDLLLRVH